MRRYPADSQAELTSSGNDKVLNNEGSQDGFIITLEEEMGVIEQEEVTIENFRKEFNITTAINRIDNIKFHL